MAKRKFVLLIMLVAVAAVAIYRPRACTDDQQDIGVKFAEASVRTDIDSISSKLPWLQIVACQWKAVVMGDGGVPGPSDVIVCGYVTTTDEYLEELRASYEWYECNVVVYMLPEGLAEQDLDLQMSAGYNSEHTPLDDGSHIQLYVDFHNRLIYFSSSI